MMNEHKFSPDKENHVTFYGIDIDKMKLINNNVLCRRLTYNAGGMTNYGIIHPEGRHENDKLSQNADRMFEVCALPEKITYGTKGWMTDIELQIGDLVWVEESESLNAPVIIDDNNQEYRLIRYFEIVVAKRLVNNIEKESTNYIVENGNIYRVIPINGYILCSDVYTEKSPGGRILTISEKTIERFKAKVEYVGKPNKYYFYSKGKCPDLDNIKVDIKPNQIIALEVKNKNPAVAITRKYLEEKMFSTFNGRKMYFFIQREDINAVIVK